MKCLFIGGHAAGRVIDVDIRCQYADIPFIPQGPATPCSDESTAESTSIFRFERYKIDFATGKDGQKRVLYVADGSGDPLDALLDFYANNPHPKA